MWDGGRRPIDGGRRPVVGGRRPVVGGRRPVVGGRRPIVGGRRTEAGSRGTAADEKRPEDGVVTWVNPTFGRRLSDCKTYLKPIHHLPISWSFPAASSNDSFPRRWLMTIPANRAQLDLAPPPPPTHTILNTKSSPSRGRWYQQWREWMNEWMNGGGWLPVRRRCCDVTWGLTKRGVWRLASRGWRWFRPSRGRGGWPARGRPVAAPPCTAPRRVARLSRRRWTCARCPSAAETHTNSSSLSSQFLQPHASSHHPIHL